jgi:hypothetical protein
MFMRRAASTSVPPSMTATSVSRKSVSINSENVISQERLAWFIFSFETSILLSPRHDEVAQLLSRRHKTGPGRTSNKQGDTA